MSLPQEYQDRLVYHFTHINNLRDLLKHGLLAKNNSSFHKCAVNNIAEPSIQSRRATMRVTCGFGGVVHDYVPFYFGSISPMLLAVVNKRNVDQQDIIYFEYRLSSLIDYEFVFTDASANTEIPPSFFDKLNSLSRLNWEAIDCKKWGASTYSKNERMAEFLVYDHVPVNAAERIVVWNERIKNKILKIAKECDAKIPPIEYESNEHRHYFCDFMNNSDASCAAGPKETKSVYKNALAKVYDRPSLDDYLFNNMLHLLSKLRLGMGNLTHTKELIGLKTANKLHNESVDSHTLAVVKNVKQSDLYKELTEENKNIVELAAYLHDIGKGPSSRWPNRIQKVDQKHPLRAMPMLVDIFTTQVREIDENEIITLFKLVCYHDLIGDILGNGRDEKQLFELIESIDELDMLFCLCKADIDSLYPEWWVKVKADELYNKAKNVLRRGQ